DFSALVAVLDPSVVMRADAAAVLAGGQAEVRGAAAVAQMLKGRAKGARLALVDGVPGVMWAPGGQPRGAIRFTVTDDKIVAIEVVMEPARLAELALAVLDG